MKKQEYCQYTQATLRREFKKRLDAGETYAALSRECSIPTGTLYDFIARERQLPQVYVKRLELRQPGLQYTRKRRRHLNMIAMAHGYNSWSHYESMILNDNATLMDVDREE